jgi:dTDP-4-amino-4,6-dideoxygalactose transaminase
MQEADIKANIHYIPVYRQPYYESIGFEAGYCPNAEKYFQQAITIPMYPTLSDVEQTKVIRTLHEILV